jgi:vanillate O-demethylase ferredoxin subunit
MNASELNVRVARKHAEALDICTFELVHAAGQALPAFSAGSHIDVHLPNGLTRQYSLCNDPQESHRYLIGVLRDPASRGGSQAMHELVQEGSLLRISAPKNHFPLAHAAARSVLIAGGIGVTPILCMAERLALSAAPFEMHYCTRSRERTAFAGRIAQSAFASQVQFHFDDGDAAQKLSLPADQLHYEFFSAEIAASDSDAAFEVKLASSGRIVKVPKDRTVVQALAEAGVEVATSCEQGVCGTCLTRVLEGEPDHKDMYLTPEEQAANDQFTPCCSRSRSPMLVLDL